MLLWLDLTRRRVVVVVITATAIIIVVVVVVAEVLSVHVVLTVVVVTSPVVIVVVVVSPVALVGEPRRRVISVQAHLHRRPVVRRHVITLFRYVHELSLAPGMVRRPAL